MTSKSEKKKSITVEEMQSPGYRIFHDTYMVWVPKAATYAEAELEERGSATTFDVATDSKLAVEPTLVGLTIARLSRMYDDNVAITLHRPRDAKEIYKTVTDYIRQSAERFNAFSLVSVPSKEQEARYIRVVEDIRLFEQFAASVAGVVERTTDVNESMTTLQSRLMQFSGFRGKVKVSKGEEGGKLKPPVMKDLLDDSAKRDIRKWRS